MLREAIKLGLLLSAAMLVYDMNKTGFYKSEVYAVLKESGVVAYGERFMHQMEIFYTKAMRFRENGASIRAPRLNFDFEPYAELIRNVLIFGKAVFLEHLDRSCYNVKKNLELESFHRYGLNGVKFHGQACSPTVITSD